MDSRVFRFPLIMSSLKLKMKQEYSRNTVGTWKGLDRPPLYKRPYISLCIPGVPNSPPPLPPNRIHQWSLLACREAIILSLLQERASFVGRMSDQERVSFVERMSFVRRLSLSQTKRLLNQRLYCGRFEGVVLSASLTHVYLLIDITFRASELCGALHL